MQGGRPPNPKAGKDKGRYKILLFFCILILWFILGFNFCFKLFGGLTLRGWVCIMGSWGDIGRWVVWYGKGHSMGVVELLSRHRAIRDAIRYVKEELGCPWPEVEPEILGSVRDEDILEYAEAVYRGVGWRAGEEELLRRADADGSKLVLLVKYAERVFRWPVWKASKALKQDWEMFRRYVELFHNNMDALRAIGDAVGDDFVERAMHELYPGEEFVLRGG